MSRDLVEKARVEEKQRLYCKIMMMPPKEREAYIDGYGAALQYHIRLAKLKRNS